MGGDPFSGGVAESGRRESSGEAPATALGGGDDDGLARGGAGAGGDSQILDAL